MGSILWIVFIAIFAATHGAPLQLHESSSSYTDVFLPSICVLVVMLVILLNCTNVGGCCLKIFGKDRSQDADASMVFNNPIADDNPHISPIDISGMELNPITFEPLPGVQHLTPESSQLFDELPRFNTDRPLRARNAKNTDNLIYSPGFPGLIHGNAITSPDLASCDWFDEPFRNFPRSNVEFVSDVGPGWFGNVVEAIAEDIVPYSKALKVNVKVLRDNADTPDKLKFLKEAQFFRDANHENVLKVLGHCIEKDPFLLIFEYFPVDLKSYLVSCVSKPDSLTSSSFHIQAALDIALGLEYMNQLDFIHPDLAARNCLVSSEGRVVIGDYGLATRTHKDDYYWNNGLAIPLRWAAPETLKCTMNIIQTLKVEKASNIWTLAVTIWELCEFGKLPYQEQSDQEVISYLISEQLYLKSPSRSGLLMKNEMCDLMQQCLNFKPEYRPQISAIVLALKDLMKLSFSKPSIRNISFACETNDEFEKKWEEASPKNKTEIVSQDGSLCPTDNALHKKTVSFSNSSANRLESSNHSVLSKSITSTSSKPGFVNDAGMTNSVFEGIKVFDGTNDRMSRNSKSDQSKTSDQSFASSNANCLNANSPNILDTAKVRNDCPSSVSGCVPRDREANASITKHYATQLQQSSVDAEVSSTSHSRSFKDQLAVKRSTRTSTPTGSPFFHGGSYNKGNASGSSDVFEEEFTMNISQSVSPITSDTDSSNVVMGPSEDLGLEAFQKVSSQLSEGLQGTVGESSSCAWETFEETIAPEQAGKSGFLDIFSGSENGPTPRQPTPFCLSLPPDRENERGGAKVAKKLLFTTADTGTSVDDLQSRTAFQDSATGIGANRYGFERDIIQATEELSSLVLQDLENESDEVTLVKETVIQYSSDDLSRQTNIMFERSDDNSVRNTSCAKDFAAEFSSPVEKFAVQGAEEPKPVETATSGLQQETSASQNYSQVQIDQCSENGYEERSSTFVSDPSASVVAGSDAVGKLSSSIYNVSEGDCTPLGNQSYSICSLEEKETASEQPASVCSEEKIASNRSTSICDEGKLLEDTSDSSQFNSELTAKLSSVEMASTGLQQSASTSNSRSKIQVDQYSSNSDEDEPPEDTSELCKNFVPSTWDQKLEPKKPALKSPDVSHQVSASSSFLEETQSSLKSNMKKSVSFERKRPPVVYQYPPPVVSDSEDDDRNIPAATSNLLDWELQPDELAPEDDTDDTDMDFAAPPRRRQILDVYSISGLGSSPNGSESGNGFEASLSHFSQDTLQAGNSESNTLGVLRHTKGKLKLDLPNSFN